MYWQVELTSTVLSATFVDASSRRRVPDTTGRSVAVGCGRCEWFCVFTFFSTLPYHHHSAPKHRGSRCKLQHRALWDQPETNLLRAICIEIVPEDFDGVTPAHLELLRQIKTFPGLQHGLNPLKAWCDRILLLFNHLGRLTVPTDQNQTI
jgi:hypothetical protein